MSLRKLRNELCDQKCERSETYPNYFEALTTDISLTTKEMKTELNYTAEVYVYNFNGGKESVESEAKYVQAVSRTNFYYILIGVICGLVGIIVIVVITRYIRMAKYQNLISNKEDNKYYSEDDI